MTHKTWVYNPHKRKRTVSDQTKLQVQLVCDRLVGEYLQPRSVRTFDPKNKKEMQCIDIQWKWYRHFIHFKAVYRDLRPDVVKEVYEYPIARLEYMDGNLFNLAYFRHTGEWSDITYGEGNSLEECLDLIKSPLSNFSSKIFKEPRRRKLFHVVPTFKSRMAITPFKSIS